MLTRAMWDSSRPARHSASRTRRTALQGPAHQMRLLPPPQTVCVARHMPAPAAATGPSSSRTPRSG